MMDTLTVLIAVWGLITILFLLLLFYRSRISRRETDWIPLSDDAREEKAIEAQKATEAKIRKFALPIRLLGILWVIMLLGVVGFWFYHGLMTPPPVAK
jgi:Na+/melibiose symporter-like transporter